MPNWVTNKIEAPEHVIRAMLNGEGRVVLHGPLSGMTYQRHGPGRWMLVEKNEGFA